MFANFKEWFLSARERYATTKGLVHLRMQMPHPEGATHPALSPAARNTLSLKKELLGVKKIVTQVACSWAN